MDRRGPYTQSRNQYSPLTRRVPGDDTATTIANQVVLGMEDFMKINCEIRKPASQTWISRVLWLFALTLMVNAASSAQDSVTEWNHNAETTILASQTVS